MNKNACRKRMKMHLKRRRVCVLIKIMYKKIKVPVFYKKKKRAREGLLA